MEPNILRTVRKICGLAADDSSFDLDLLIHINAALSILAQLGIGPAEGLEVEADTVTWEDLFGTDPLVGSIRTYICLRVRMYFDPPQTSFHINAINEQLRELEFRLNVRREEVSWTDPMPTTSFVSEV